MVNSGQYLVARPQRVPISGIVLLLLGFGFSAQVAAVEPRCAPREVLVRWEGGRAKPAARMAVAKLNERYGLEKEEPLWPDTGRLAKASAAGALLERWEKLTFAAWVDPEEVAVAYGRLPGVGLAQPNYLRHYTAVPDDALYRQQWSLSAMGWDWNTEPRAEGIVVAILDSGIDWHHPDLAGQIWENPAETQGKAGVDDDGNGYLDDVRGWDFSDAPGLPGEGDYLIRDAEPNDESGHGTHVAGIVGAIPNNRIGIAGVAPGVRLMVLRAGFNMGGGGFLEDDDVAAALVYAADQGADVVNMSFGDPNFSPLIRDVVRYAAQAGCTLVAAVGNENSEAVFYPARLGEVIAVAATGPGNEVLAFSNSGYSLDLAGPGQAVLSLLPGGGYIERSGTSMAAAMVSGLAALVLGRHPEFTPQQVRGALTSGALDLGALGWDMFAGAGLGQVAARKVDTPPTLLLSAESGGEDKILVRLEMTGGGDYDLSWGEGDEPARWNVLDQGQIQTTHVVDLSWSKAGLREGDYLLRGRFFTQEGTLEERVQVQVNRRAGLVRDLRVYPALEGGKWVQVAEWESEGGGVDTLIIRRAGSREELYQIPETSTRRQHWLRLPEDLLPGEYGAQIGATGSEVDFSLGFETVFRWSMDQKGLLPEGYLLPALSDFNGNGLPEVVAMLSRGNRYNPVAFYEAGKLPATYTSPLVFIPWSLADLDGDGHQELVAVDAQRVRLIEAPDPHAYPSQSIWQQDDAWGGEVADLDGDGREELLARSAKAQLFQVIEGRGDNTLVETGVLPNPTGGSNELGERQVAADLDGDGRGELLSGDEDGDLFIYEAIGDDTYRLTWKEEGLQPPADARLVGGGVDLDGDGNKEFVVGRLYQDPFEVQQTRWLIEVYQASGDNTFVREWQIAALGGKAGGNGIALGDWDGDGSIEFAVALPPHLYLFSATGTDTYGPVWAAGAGDAHQPVSGDLDGDGLRELLFNTGGGIGLFSRHSGLASPAGLAGHAVDQRAIALRWDPVEAATSYRVYRDGVLLADPVPETFFEDREVETGQEYEYTVTALAGAGESARSASVRLRPQESPRVLAVKRLATRQLGVDFSQVMAAPLSYRLRLDPGVGIPTSVVLDHSGRRLLLGFERALPDSGLFTLVFKGVENALGSPLAAAEFAFELEPLRQPARLLAAGVRSPQEVVVQFSRPIPDPGPQSFAFADGVTQVTGARSAGAEVILDLAPPLQPLGRRYELLVSALVDEEGNQIDGKVFLDLAAPNLSQVRVFPNPFRPVRGKATFAFLPAQAQVLIFDLEGRLVQVLKEEEGDGGVFWDGTSAAGQALQSGVYLFRVLSGVDQYQGKLALIRE